MTRVLIADDSAFMRIALKKMLSESADIQIVGEAANGQLAVQMAKELRPDVITMDVEMPVMNGLDAVREIMASHPTPVIMVSSLTEKDSETTMRALSLGAVDFIAKQSSFVQLDIVKIGQELIEKLRFWGSRKSFRLPTAGSAGASASSATGTTFTTGAAGTSTSLRSGDSMLPAAGKSAGLPVLRRAEQRSAPGLIVIGISTGGPATLPRMLKTMGRLKCPVVIAQHMPPMFTQGLATHLRKDTGLNVVESTDNLKLEPGMVVIAKGGTDLIVRELTPGHLTVFERLDAGAGIHPNADVLFTSAAKISCEVLGVVMTGMGSDGTRGSKELVDRKGAMIIAQESSSCVVDGMPHSVVEAELASAILPPEDIGRRLARIAGVGFLDKLAGQP